jgi:hypothetical protein
LSNTTIDVNSTEIIGRTPIKITLMKNMLDAGMLLVEKGANLFMKNKDGERSIDVHDVNHPEIVLGPQVLQHALDLSWSSVKHLLLISNFHETADIASSLSSSSSTAFKAQHRSHLAASVFTIQGLVRHIAEYLIRTEIIVREPRDDDDDDADDDEQEPDDVKRRIEAALAVAEGSNKRTRNK